LPLPPPITEPAPRSGHPDSQEWTLVYDGGCPFCRHFALSSELRGGIPNLRIVDGRTDHRLRRRLQARGLALAEGAVLLQGERAWHGAAAVQRLCGLMRPSDPLLRLLVLLFEGPSRSDRLYPLLLAARRMALALKGLPVDPDGP
jgi:predicted DCC family thiol-disulfide oxidoreductase YuxK